MLVKLEQLRFTLMIQIIYLLLLLVNLLRKIMRGVYIIQKMVAKAGRIYFSSQTLLELLMWNMRQIIQT